MAFSNEVTVADKIPGRRIILAKTTGKSNPADISWFTEYLLAEVDGWKETGWAYIADISSMSPVFAPESAKLIELVRTFVDAGCKAVAYVGGKSSMIRIQARDLTKRSATGIKEGHFQNLQDALDWIAQEFDF